MWATVSGFGAVKVEAKPGGASEASASTRWSRHGASDRASARRQAGGGARARTAHASPASAAYAARRESRWPEGAAAAAAAAGPRRTSASHRERGLANADEGTRTRSSVDAQASASAPPLTESLERRARVEQPRTSREPTGRARLPSAARRSVQAEEKLARWRSRWRRPASRRDGSAFEARRSTRVERARAPSVREARS